MAALVHTRGIVPGFRRILADGMIKHLAHGKGELACRLELKHVQMGRQFPTRSILPKMSPRNTFIKNVSYLREGPVHIRLFHSTSWLCSSDKENDGRDVDNNASDQPGESRRNMSDQDTNPSEASVQDRDDAVEDESHEEGDEVLTLSVFCLHL
jgi:hypothetical protein